VQSERGVGVSGGLWRDQTCVRGHMLRRGMIVNGALYVWGELWQVFVGGGAFVSSVYCGWVLFGAPYCLSFCKIWIKSDSLRPNYSDLPNWTWPPSAILDIQAGALGPLHVFWDPIFHARTIFCEDILIGAGVIPPKRNSKKRTMAAEFFFWFQGWRLLSLGGSLYVSSCKISAKPDSWRPSYSDLTILPLGAHF